MNHVNGIDVSDFQNGIDFERVKSAGYSFVYAKATESVSFRASTYARNRQDAPAAGLYFGAYHFFDWTEDPETQAAFFLATADLRPSFLPPVLDAEGELPPDAIARVAAFVRAVDRAVAPAKTVIYSSLDDAETLGAGGDFAGHPLWLALPGASVPPGPVAGWDQTKLWQRSFEGNVDGVAGAVDLDWFLGTIDDLHAFTIGHVA